MNKTRAIIPCLIILACYVPLIWYVMELRVRYSSSLNILDLPLFEVIVVLVFMVVPPWLLSMLNIGWKREQPIN